MATDQDNPLQPEETRKDPARAKLRMAPRDLYRLRRAHLMARRAALRAQYAQQQLDELSLEMERRYGLLARDAVLDIKSGRIAVSSREAADGGPESFVQPVE